jgi:hypothetical protein
MAAPASPDHGVRSWPARPLTLDAATGLTAIVVVLGAAAAISGLLVDGLYRDNPSTAAGWRANDLVTLVTLPLLVGAYARARRGSSRGCLLWLGVLWYLVYNYAFYLVGTALNDVFLLYAALVAAGMWALGVGLAGTDVGGIARRLRPTAPARWVAGYLALAAVGLAGAWTAQSLAFALDGTVPQIMLDTDSKTPIVFALDLTLVVPTMLVAAGLLWRRRAWGHVLGTIVGVKGVLYACVLLAMAADQANRGEDDAWSFAPVSAFLLLGCLFVATCLLRDVRDRPRAPS